MIPLSFIKGQADGSIELKITYTIQFQSSCNCKPQDELHPPYHTDIKLHDRNIQKREKRTITPTKNNINQYNPIYNLQQMRLSRKFHISRQEQTPDNPMIITN